MHPGGIQNEIDLVRGKKKKPDLHGQGRLLEEQEEGRRSEDSWDFSMPVVGNPFWGIR